MRALDYDFSQQAECEQLYSGNHTENTDQQQGSVANPYAIKPPDGQVGNYAQTNYKADQTKAAK